MKTEEVTITTREGMMDKQLCLLCDIRKPKRECRFHGEICSLCCGERRDDKCTGCEYYNLPEVVSSLPVYKCAILSGPGVHSIVIAKESQNQRFTVIVILVELLSEGISDVKILENKSKLEVDNMLKQKSVFLGERKEISLREAKKIIKLGVAKKENKWNISGVWKRSMELIGGLD